jgi:hypothetical protein
MPFDMPKSRWKDKDTEDCSAKGTVQNAVNRKRIRFYNDINQYSYVFTDFLNIWINASITER